MAEISVAFQELAPLVYPHLRQVAAAYLRREAVRQYPPTNRTGLTSYT